MSKGIVTTSVRRSTFGRKIASRPFTRITLFVQGSNLGFVSTKLRAHSEDSLDAIYRAIESSALGTLSRKHFWFVLEDEDRILSVCAAYLTHYYSPSDALQTRFAQPKLLKRRSMRRLKECLGTEAARMKSQEIMHQYSFEAGPDTANAVFEAQVDFAVDQGPVEGLWLDQGYTEFPRG